MEADLGSCLEQFPKKIFFAWISTLQAVPITTAISSSHLSSLLSRKGQEQGTKEERKQNAALVMEILLRKLGLHDTVERTNESGQIHLNFGSSMYRGIQAHQASVPTAVKEQCYPSQDFF